MCIEPYTKKRSSQNPLDVRLAQGLLENVNSRMDIIRTYIKVRDFRSAAEEARDLSRILIKLDEATQP